jgi:hypothetical protein
MPFTLSHPAAVIPIRRYGVFSALVIGSMMPDTLYFMPRVESHETYGHTLSGLFLYCMPAGLALLWLFHAFLKRPLMSLFPESQQRKLQAVAPDFRFFPPKRFAALAISVLIGAASHITWDAVTHANQFGAQIFPSLRHVVRVPPHSYFVIADLLQLGSSVVGLAVLFLYYSRWLRTAQQREVQVHLPASVRGMLLVAFAAGTVAPTIARLLLNPVFWNFKRVLLSYAAMVGIKVMCVEVLIFCVAWHLFFGGRNDQSPMRYSS